MTYTVHWTPNAEQELAALWLDAAQRSAITRAAHAIDLQLETDADNKGESRAEEGRVLIEPPLGVVFEAFPAQGLVLVAHVWTYRTGGR